MMHLSHCIQYHVQMASCQMLPGLQLLARTHLSHSMRADYILTGFDLFQPRRHASLANLDTIQHLLRTIQADGNSTGTGNPAGYCYKEQPAWSAYREPSFGHGTLDVINATTALWSVCLSVTLGQSAF